MSVPASLPKITTDLEGELTRLGREATLRARRTTEPCLGRSGRRHTPAIGIEVSENRSASARLCVMDIVRDGELADLQTLSHLADLRDDLGAARAALVSRRGFRIEVMKAAGFLAIDLVVFDEPKASRPTLDDQDVAGSRTFDYFLVNGTQTLEPFRLDEWLRGALLSPCRAATASEVS